MRYLGSKKIVTKRLELRKQKMNEQKYLWELLMDNKVNKYFLTIPPKFGEKLRDWNIQEKFYKEKIDRVDDLKNFEWSIFLKDTDICIGRIDCHKKEADENIRDVGWIIDPKYQKKGYASEAAYGMLDFMFNTCGIKEVLTSAAIENPASWKLMEKLGFKRQKNIVYNQYTYVENKTECYSYYLNKEMFNKLIW